MNLPPNIMQMMNMFTSSRNPQAMLQNMINSNPQMRTMLTQLQNSSGGKSPKEIAMQLGKQNGMSEQDIMQMYNQITHPQNMGRH